MQQNEDAMKNQQNEIEDLKRKLRLKDEAEAKVSVYILLLPFIKFSLENFFFNILLIFFLL